MKVPQAGPSHSFPVILVQIEDVDDAKKIAIARDTFGKRHQIRTDVRRVGWFTPRVGEIWFIDRTLGFWTFAAIIDPIPDPDYFEDVVNDGNPALTKLLSLMHSLKLIDDKTIPPPGPISTHEHP